MTNHSHSPTTINPIITTKEQVEPHRAWGCIVYSSSEDYSRRKEKILDMEKELSEEKANAKEGTVYSV